MMDCGNASDVKTEVETGFVVTIDTRCVKLVDSAGLRDLFVQRT